MPYQHQSGSEYINLSSVNTHLIPLRHVGYSQLSHSKPQPLVVVHYVCILVLVV